jgi:hypothetical protein
MPFVVVLIGALIVIAGFNSTHGQLATQLKQDIPGYFKWGAAIAAILALGFVPGLKVPSRYLLALVLLVIFLHNYQNIINGFKNFASSGGTSSGAAADLPTAAFTASAGQSLLPPTPQQIAGDATGATPAIAGGGATPANPGGGATPSLNPVSTLESGFSGAASLFGG